MLVLMQLLMTLLMLLLLLTNDNAYDYYINNSIANATLMIIINVNSYNIEYLKNGNSFPFLDCISDKSLYLL